jgi:hypothetical protein
LEENAHGSIARGLVRFSNFFLERDPVSALLTIAFGPLSTKASSDRMVSSKHLLHRFRVKRGLPFLHGAFGKETGGLCDALL